jgi:hypothetical protein
MKRSLFAAVVLSLAVSAPAFAEGGGGIGHAGTYGYGPTSVGPSQVTRADVKAEIATAYLPSLNKPTYPNLSLQGQRQAARFAAEGQNGEGTTSLARGE